jgi:hypothetical protein
MFKSAYFIFNFLICIIALIALGVLLSSPSFAQDKGVISSPERMSAELIAWLKTGMTVVAILTFLFGVHNMWLHNKFTAFKEQTVTLIRQEFEPRINELKHSMATKDQIDSYKQIQEEILKRIEGKVNIGIEKMDDAKRELEKVKLNNQ